MGEILLAQQASLSAMVTYRALQWAHDWICSCTTAVLPNLAEYHYFLVEKPPVAFAIFHGQCHASQ